MAGKLDAKQLAESSKQILKAAEGGDPSSTILSLLRPLESWKATEDALRATKLGIAVSKLRVNPDKKVASLATQLVLKWKSDVKKRPGTPGGSPAPKGALATTANGAVNGRSSTNSPAPAPVPKAASPAKKSTIDPEKRNSKADGVETALTGDATRDGCVKLMYDGLAFMSEEAPGDIIFVARSVERAAYTHFQSETSAAYKTKMRSLFQNLKMKGSTQLRQDVYSGKISPERLVKMTTDELKSEEKRQEDEVLKKENMNKSRAPEEEKAISTTMTCSKCKANRVAYTQAQTRSADEPMTTFCECMNCGKTWRFS